jgi:hypothetical protein
VAARGPRVPDHATAAGEGGLMRDLRSRSAAISLI